jgi:hypothetical protein
MFFDCPACLGQDGAAPCGLSVEVRCRFTMHSTDGALERRHDQMPRRTLVQRAYRIADLTARGQARARYCDRYAPAPGTAISKTIVNRGLTGRLAAPRPACSTSVLDLCRVLSTRAQGTDLLAHKVP